MNIGFFRKMQQLAIDNDCLKGALLLAPQDCDDGLFIQEGKLPYIDGIPMFF
jgi:hypothetical protein